jgi:hypothetical protein
VHADTPEHRRSSDSSDREAELHTLPAQSAHWRRYMREVTAREISSMSRYYDRLIQYGPLPVDDGELFDCVEARDKLRLALGQELPDLSAETDRRTLVLLNGTIHHDMDIQATFTALAKKMSRSTRIVLVAYNPYQKMIQNAVHHLSQREGDPPSTFLTLVQLRALAALSGLQIVRVRPAVFFPMRAGGIGSVINRIFCGLPGAERLSAAWVITLRATKLNQTRPSLSVVIPARNERGNLEGALKRLRYLNESVDMEVLFVEGHSQDGTWEEILRLQKVYSPEFSIKSFRQTGVGKNDAVRLGFEHASKTLLTILDADLTMPPELLHRFYDAYCAGLGDFINGDRLTYPMEGAAMRPLNFLGNVFFAKALSSTLDTPLGDTLCGTKLLSASDYRRILAWRRDFGDFDPFGDFELLFPAAVLGLGVVDIPIRYRDRQYGSTSISRFRHGAQLLRMTGIGLTKIKAGRG